MAGDWIKMEVCLPDKPEVWRMAGILSIDADSVVGKLLRVWAWFDSHTEDGNAVGVSYALIDRVAGVAGFAEAMALSGWLHQNGHMLSLPKFGRHNGKTAKNRALTNDRVAKHRNSNAQTNDEVTQTPLPEALPKPLPEKRREEKSSNSAEALTVADFVADGLTEQTAREWIASRRKKGASLGRRAWEGIKAEAVKAGWTPEAAVTKALARGWQSFDAGWLQGEKKSDHLLGVQ